MIRHPDSNLQIAEKIELALSSQNKRVNTEGTNIVTNEFNREDYVINKAQTEISLQSLVQGKQDVLTAGDGITINNNSVISVDKVPNAITFSDTGEGAESGSTFDGSAARTLSWNSIGAAKKIILCKIEIDDNFSPARHILVPDNSTSISAVGSWFFVIFNTNGYRNNMDSSLYDQSGNKIGSFTIKNSLFYCYKDNVIYVCERTSKTSFVIYKPRESLPELYFRNDGPGDNPTWWATFSTPDVYTMSEFIFHVDEIIKTGSSIFWWQTPVSTTSYYFYLDGVRYGRAGEFTLPNGFYRCKITGTPADHNIKYYFYTLTYVPQTS